MPAEQNTTTRDQQPGNGLEVDETRLKPKGLVDRLIPRSETSTPYSVRTAAEVADSAAIVDQEESEPYMSDEMAGRTGARRLSSTPIAEVARTASDVADTAKLLDKDSAAQGDPAEVPPDKLPGKLGVRQLSSTPIIEDAKTASEVAGTAKSLKKAPEKPNIHLAVSAPAFEDSETFIEDAAESSAGRAPLFAHECAGIYEDDVHDPDHPVDERTHHHPAGGRDYDPDLYDLNDPTLERFPSNRDEIMDTVRKMESGLGADQTSVEGVPPSPIVGSIPKNENFPEDSSTSPPSSPIAPRSNKRLRVQRLSQGSTSDKSSIVSLTSIAEGEEHREIHGKERPAVVMRKYPSDNLKSANLKDLDSEEDEAVVMKEAKQKAAP